MSSFNPPTASGNSSANNGSDNIGRSFEALLAQLNEPRNNGGHADVDSNHNLEGLLAQLRQQSGTDSPAPEPDAARGHHGHGHGQDQFYYNQAAADSPRLDNTYDSAMDSPAFPPSAPTPPVQGFVNSSFPPSLMGSFGAGARGPPGDDRTANLLNLLRFSGQSSNLSAASPAPRQAPNILQQPQLAQAVIHSPAPASADPTGLLAALMKGSLQGSLQHESAKPEPPAPGSTWNATETPSGTQQYLLNLLNRPKSDSNDATTIDESPHRTRLTPQSSQEPVRILPGNSGTQQYLLNLLNRPKPSQTDVTTVDEPTHRTTLTPQSSQEPFRKSPGDAGSRASAEATQVPAGLPPTRASFDFEPSTLESPPPKFGSSPQSHKASAAPKPGLFNYTNPFEDLAASSPLQRTPKSSNALGSSGSATGNSQPVLRKTEQLHPILDQKRPSTDRSPLQSPEHTRRKLGQTSSPLSNNILDFLPQPHSAGTSPHDDKINPTVAEAVSELAGRADIEAQEALARAEEEQTQIEIGKDLDAMIKAKSDEEFDKSAQHAAQAIQKELLKEGNEDVLESTLSAEVAKEVRDIVDEAAAGSHGPVADSWESAEADEIVVIEEDTTPIKVFNLPMKPWISIILPERPDDRPQFREEAILDIARLKKDFDQIDRNLVAASENYITYGMSKHGGLRVIRQTDGLDVKLFTDTHDRIFNVAMSCTPLDQNVTPKEAIIGTGVSGAVYWIQVKNGQKEHLDDAHREQYGFALPPISTTEGDTPGGVLKTRARTSAAHPDYFAVGRGKSINIIWPSFVMAKNIFKPGHDRVVDTEKLFKQCSLKINTGKAGKDFTFSRDDTTVVSLDKSGRVKFWDVRDLTAVAEDSDHRNPMPARTSLEIKEPLMTLTSTPEGEKAWPTSVLLLDKLRPYQRNTALRYMIVGMKQNHTLQLWDLALGKPVQEFNLPHSKESDAVCSVVYHPPSGMIVVGHPTRNSIYFLHLSAPKYAIKNLSQVEYIQRLVAQDSSIPTPDSTAVISGIREYSFANKGVLRSLDIMVNKSPPSADAEDESLFDLYAVHSKGVTCLSIRQAELGWDKDNKVMNPIDALATGVAKIAKLVAPPSPQAAEPQAVAPAEPSLPIRLATRSNIKDPFLKTPSVQGEDKKAAEAATPVKVIPDRKEVDAPVATPVERPERKSRKKKANANIVPVAEREFLVPANPTIGRSSSPHAKPGRGGSRAVDTLQPAPAGISAAELTAVLSTVGERVDTSMKERLRAALTEMATQLNQQQIARENAFLESQGGLLQRVSEVLDENTQNVLKNIVKEQFEQAVVPTVRDTVSKAVAEQLGSRFNKDIGQSVQRELQKVLPNAVGQALSKPETTKSISDKVVQNLGAHIDEHLLNTLNTHLIPAFATVAGQAVQRLGDDVHRQMSDDMGRLEEQHRSDAAKIDQLVAQTTHLSNLISTMAASQTQIQKEFLTLKQHMREREASAAQPPAPVSVVASNHAAQMASPISPAAQNQAVHRAAQSHGHPRGNGGAHPSEMNSYNQQRPVHHQQHPQQAQQAVFSPRGQEQMHQRDPVVEMVDELMANGSYDEAMMRFLQAQGKEEEIFEQVIVKYNPEFVAQLQPLLLLSVGATVSASFDGPHVAEKLGLTELVIYHFNQMLPGLDDQLREVTPKIMGLLKSRLEQLFLRIQRLAPNDPTLKNLTNMANVAGRIAESVQRSSGSRDSLY